MAYDKQTWYNGEEGGTPLNASRLNHMEDGVEGAYNYVDEVTSDKVTVVQHEADSTVVRPTVDRVLWEGSVNPDNATAGDLLSRTDENQMYRYDGTAWAPLGSGEGGGGGDVPSPHELGGEHHSADTLANLNAKISDATLDDSESPRDPNPHEHTESDITDLGSYPDATGQIAGQIAETDGSDGWVFVETPESADANHDHDDTYLMPVEHGTDTTVARPTGAARVLWIGSAAPDNGTENDLLVRTDEDAWYRYDGTSWTPVGGAGGDSDALELKHVDNPPDPATDGGVIYVQNGALFYTGGNGTITQIAEA